VKMGWYAAQSLKRKCAAIMMYVFLSSALLAYPSNARIPQEVHCGRTAFVQHSCCKYPNRLFSVHQPSSFGPSQRLNSATVNFMANHDGDDDDTEIIDSDPRRPDKTFPEFFDAMLEIPDPRLLAGDLLFILIINFLLQIANEVGDQEFWMNGGFSQAVTMPTTLLPLMVRDSKMSLAWLLSALRNRSYSSSSVSDDQTAVKNALRIWVDYCSLRILLELGESFLFTHSGINIWLLGREAWYTAIVMTFFRLAYGRVN